MADNGNVVDELVVKLKLDAAQYERADKEVDNLVTKTEKKRVVEDSKRKKREQDQLKRTKEATRATKGWALAVRGLSTVAGTAALAVTASFAAMSKLAGFETNLRRAAVSTNLSNRELQAWGSTARRLGADAQAGQQAIAELAREQQQFGITGQAPTMQALARLGVNVGQNVSLPDMLEQAQRMYRQSSPAQQRQIESSLSAQGVSNDLIVMIKSETDARQAYAQSVKESATENRSAINAVNAALTTMANSAVNVGNALATIAQPAVQEFAKWVSDGATELSAWNDRVIAAGGGIQGLGTILTQDFPKSMKVVTDGLQSLGRAVDVLAYGMQEAWRGLEGAFGWLSKREKKNITPRKPILGFYLDDWLGEKWKELVGVARKEGPAPVEHYLQSHNSTAGSSAPLAVSSAQDIMSKLVTHYGLSVDQAAAVAASIGGESSFNPAAFNPAGGGQGARGLFQLRGARISAFQSRYGVLPNQATVDQQLAFAFSDPYERGLIKQALAGAGGPEGLGTSFSRVFEAQGNAAIDAARGRTAAQYAAAYNGPVAGQPGASSAQISISGPVTVQANNPNEFVGGITRLASPQNYSSAT